MSQPILTVEQMRAWEKATWETGQSEETVIAQVGEIVAERALAMTHSGDPILILAGKGHNGDDARLSQPHLNDRTVILLNLVDPESQLEQVKQELRNRPALVIDGLFGIGMNRPLKDGWPEVMEAVNASSLPVLSVDCPSGLNCRTGEPEGAAVKASVTLTLGAVKDGLIQPSAWPYTGRLELAPEIGLCPCPTQADWHWTLDSDFSDYPPAPAVDCHKGRLGHLAILAGSVGYHGAAVLAARAAQQAHPGLITLVVPEEIYPPVAGQLQALMVHPWREDFTLPETVTGVLFGPGCASPGLPESFRNFALEQWRSSDHPVIVDASGLNWIRGESTKSSGIRVITPHPGEAARLLDTNSASIQSDRPAALKQLAEAFPGATVVLKGFQSLVGNRESQICFNNSGSPALAQGGTGDVLAGFLAGLLAQPGLRSDALKSVRYAVWRHGKAAETRWDGIVEHLIPLLNTFRK